MDVEILFGKVAIGNVGTLAFEKHFDIFETITRIQP